MVMDYVIVFLSYWFGCLAILMSIGVVTGVARRGWIEENVKFARSAALIAITAALLHAFAS